MLWAAPHSTVSKHGSRSYVALRVDLCKQKHAAKADAFSRDSPFLFTGPDVPSSTM